MYTMMAIVVAIFWVVGVVTGIVSTVLFLNIDTSAALKPVKRVSASAKNMLFSGYQRIFSSFKGVFEYLLTPIRKTDNPEGDHISHTV